MHNQFTYRFLFAVIALCSFLSAYCQSNKGEETVPKARSHRESTVRVLNADSIAQKDSTVNDVFAVQLDSVKADADEKVDMVVNDSVHGKVYTLTADSVDNVAIPLTKERFIPNPKKAMWLAIVFPGGGQIYNRKYWKLPLIYGGFLGCVYAMNWNNTMYRDYSQAYIDIMDSNPDTKSYEKFLPQSYDVNANMSRLQQLFKRKKDFYRRYRDLSLFCMMGVYALSIIDAYVDAELSSFDISRDLSMKVHPAIINDRHSAMRASGMSSTSYGLQCSLNF